MDMASARSLGISIPSALPYLVSEGILPPEPKPSEFSWQYLEGTSSRGSSVSDELVITKSCIVWSKSGVIRRTFRFDIENEPVRFALFTTFSPGSEERAGELVSSGSYPTHAQSNPKTTTGESSHTTKDFHEYEGLGQEKLDQHRFKDGSTHFDKRPDKDRALVAILKTQAHIFFLSGTSHVVHLPFEVAAVFSTPHGLILQREADETIVGPSTPRHPFAPANSFSLSQLDSSGKALGAGISPFRVALPSQETKATVLTSLLKAVSTPAGNQRLAGLPSHFRLRDPLTELTVLKATDVTVVDPSIGKRKSPMEVHLDVEEKIVYVSSQNEIGEFPGSGEHTPSLLLAVSFNYVTSTCNIWIVSKRQSQASKATKKRFSAAVSGAVSRRRSSFGPGTGTTTPAVRTSMGPRESFGGLKEIVRDPTLVRDDVELASQLDPTFENMGSSMSSSRRISSLLARSDLAMNRDLSAFGDISSGHAQGLGPRRGASFGGVRNSLGNSQGHNLRKTFDNQYAKTDLTEMPDLSMDDQFVCSETEDEVPQDHSKLHGVPRHSSDLVVFTKIHSLQMPAFGQSFSTHSSTSSRLNAFTMRATSSRSPNMWELILCIADRESQILSIVYIDAILTTNKAKGRQHGCEIITKVTGCQTLEGVIDACKIASSITSRIMVLGSTDDGFGALSLQSPWSTSIPVLLPSRLLVSHPYQVDHWSSATRQRDCGINRVLSDRPAAMCALKQRFDMEQVDFQDSEGTLHRLEIQMRPSDVFVVKAIRVCQAVLAPGSPEREPLLRAWWEIKVWICGHSRVDMSSDWTAFVVMLFLMFAVFLDNQLEESPLRTKRKTRLLRSSSGTQVDLESFEAMASGECGWGNNTFGKLRGSNWQWAFGNGESSAAEHVSTKESRVSHLSLPRSTKKLSFLSDCAGLAREFKTSEGGRAALGELGYLPTASCHNLADRQNSLPIILFALHLLGEELKLDVLASSHLQALTPVLAQMGGWLNWEAWGWGSSSFYMSANSEMDRWHFDIGKMDSVRLPQQKSEPPSILKEIENIRNGAQCGSFPTLFDIVSAHHDQKSASIDLETLTPRTLLALDLCRLRDSSASDCVARIERSGLSMLHLDTFPEGIAAPLRSVLAKSQANPGLTPSSSVLAMIDRDDIAMLDQCDDTSRPQIKTPEVVSHDATRDFHAVCNSTLEVEQVGSYDGSAELDRQSITRMIFKDDQRFGEAARLLHPLKPALERCVPEPEWSDTDLLEAQQEMVKVIAMRTLSFSPGRGMLFYSARFPLLTEKFPIHGFSLSCVMKPSNTTVTADRNMYVEEKVSWAFFHAGAEAGLSISKRAKGVDTSWILFNKPQELNNRHAGFLLALGLNGHLKSIAKWVAFKYLTPKHTMTSIGLLLGLAVSYLGTMDTLITRLLSVHVTRMLPPGAAELNLSPLTQTTGIMAIGLLYCGTQHRRMSEIMLSEMENIEQDDSTNSMGDLRDEGYRLAAGFALGYINLGQGKNLKGLHDMQIVERLLALAVATKRVDIVHILDKATAAATIATALIFMKTEDAALARKIDVPDTIHQFEYVRPDIFLLRTVARHLIMWNGILPTMNWMEKQLPKRLQPRIKLNSIHALHTGHLPLFNIIAGICLSIGLRFAGTARQDVRDLLSHYLDQFIRISRLPALNYDSKLTRITTRNCQDTVALAAASVMAGTGDIYLFRRLRALHGRTGSETPFGSHLAAHQAIGVLFLGGGTYTFNTSNIAVASLLCAFYPLFPTTVQDNKSHLQAFRHFWVLACEPRCLIVRNVETLRPVALPIVIVLRSGKELEANAPCLLPKLDSISRIFSNDPRFWRATLDLASNPAHVAAFNRHQSMFVRRRGAYDASSSVFAATIQALNDRQLCRQMNRHIFEWIFELRPFAGFDRAERSLVIPAETSTILHTQSRITAVDDRLCLATECLESTKSERLWNLRALFAWADDSQKSGGKMGWIGKEVVDGLRAKIALVWRDRAQ